jgi:formiminoglutamase
MIDLKDYFNPVCIEKKGYHHLTGAACFSHNVTIHTENNPVKDIGKYRVAILGVPEERNSPNKGAAKSTAIIRDRLYRLTRIPGKSNIIDLGDMKNGAAFSDSIAGLTDIIKYLMEENVFPLIIGGNSALVLSVDRCLSLSKLPYTLTTVDSRIDFTSDRKEVDPFNYLNRIIYSSTSSLDHFINIGYQTYLNDQQVINRLSKRNAELVRIGDVRPVIHLTEPLLRDSDVAVFDISAVRQADAPGSTGSSPNGFYGEEICLLARYAGISDQLKVFGLFEVNPDLDNRFQTSDLAAQIIWFFLEGFAQKQYESPGSADPSSGRFIRYHVHVTDLKDDLIFVKSNMTDRWWIEIKDEKHNNKYIACSHEDYLKANRDEVPDRWINAEARLKS